MIRDNTINNNHGKIDISAIVLAKNEEVKLPDCLKSLTWVDEIVLVDTGSKDRTIDIARQYRARVINYHKGGYSEWRNKGKEEAKGKWIFYVDADERVSPQLRDEVETLISQETPYNAYAIPRKNIILGKEMLHGGWWPDHVKRLYKKNGLNKWTGALHEEPEFKGELGFLSEPLIHIKHDNLSDMIEKSNLWSVKEAELLLKASHPQMVWWRFIRIMLTELYYRLITLKGYLDGVEGIIYACYQMWYRFMVYAKLWEMQKYETNKN
jgi:glycosyltransferase involved in cell wall biosynthesis